MEQITGKVKVSGAYFLKMAKADYRNYREALWREIYQNSIDAGATEINVTSNREERSITIRDNGCGMSLEILKEKLLALGGTHKAEGSTGAFGKAKELELFSWKEYMLSTHNLLLMGSGDDYTITETENYCDGTSITLYIQEEEDFGSLCSFAMLVAQRIETSTTIYVEGNPIECNHRRGQLVKSLEVGDVYVNNDLPTGSYAHVRMNGIWMFEQYVGSDVPHITLELSGDSIRSLTSNRDGLKDNSLASANEFFRKLASDRRSALFPDKELVTLRAKGTDGTKIELTNDDLNYLDQFADQDINEFISLAAKYITLQSKLGIDEQLTKVRMKAGFDKYDYEQMKYFGFRWDTIHKFEKGQEREAKDFLDGSAQNARRAKVLMTLWGEVLRQTFLDLRRYETFTIGFSWDSDQQASMERADDGLFFYLNPKILEKYSLKNKKKLVRKLRLLAAHEIAHLWETYHDECFLDKYDDFQERTWDSDAIYDQIAKIKD
jgi:hypothetical protein